MLNMFEVHHGTVVEEHEIKRPFVKPRPRWKNNKKRYKKIMTDRPKLN